MTGGVLLLAAVLGLLGVRAVKKGTPPVPEQALEEVKRTSAALKAAMAATNGRTPEQVRRDIEAERDRLADAVDDLRGEMDVNAKLQAKLPLAAAAALGAGFVVSGGIGATMRLLMRRSREGKTKARFGPFSLVDRD